MKKKQNIFRWLLSQWWFYIISGLWGIIMLLGSIGMGTRFIAFFIAFILFSILICLVIIAFKYIIKFIK